LSPIDFIKQMRIKKALKLMEDTSLSITDIAYKVGFADPKYFSKCFKAEMGMTPKQYANSLTKRF
jgi:transcriptional regulator GlxA family with amidase domain